MGDRVLCGIVLGLVDYRSIVTASVLVYVFACEFFITCEVASHHITITISFSFSFYKIRQNMFYGEQ